MIHPALFTEYVAAYDWTERPPTPGGSLRWLHHTQRGEDLVPNPAETIVVSTKCSVPSSVDVPLHWHGVSIIMTYNMCPAFFYSLYCRLFA